MNYKNLTTSIFTFIFLVNGSLQLVAQTGVSLRPKVYLQGALEGLLPAATLMRDDLRTLGYLPMTEPYTGLANFQHRGGGGGETIADPAILQATGANAIVDWVVVELRQMPTVAPSLATRSALLQRDGDVVGMDGVSPVNFNQAPGNYHVIIRHRNHISVMSKMLALTSTATTINFADPGFHAFCDDNQAIIGNKSAMWGGDCNRDGRNIYQGPMNDRSSVFFGVLSDAENTLLLANYISKGYSVHDLNMDGKAIYAGPNNDISRIFKNIMTYPLNTYSPPISNYIIHACIND